MSETCYLCNPDYNASPSRHYCEACKEDYKIALAYELGMFNDEEMPDTFLNNPQKGHKPGSGKNITVSTRRVTA